MLRHGNRRASSQRLQKSSLVSAFALSVLLQPLDSIAQQATTKAQDWREDLRVLSTELPRLHANFFFQLPQDVFNSEVALLDRDMPSLTDEQIIIRMAEIVALAGDSHTNLHLVQNKVPFRMLPIRLQWFSDGLFVIQAATEYRSALGCKLVRIGDTDIHRACERVGRLISHENEPWKEYISQSYLAIPEVLWALGFVPSKESAHFALQDEEGKPLVLDLPSVGRTSTIDWVTAMDHRRITPPLYLKHYFSAFTYWAEYLTASKLLYVKYNQCRSDPGLPFQYLAEELMDYINAGRAKRVVVDVRNNTGGDASIIAPLYSGLRAGIAAGLIDAGDIAVIIGRQTASAAMLNAWQLKRIGARLIGEATGGKPNSYGEISTLTLPRSGIGVKYSTKFVQMLEVNTPSLMPDVAAAASSKDYFHGRDPALEVILGGAADSSSLGGFVLYKSGGLSHGTAGAGPSTTAGYGILESRDGDQAPAGLSIVTVRRTGITAGEFAVAATAPAAGGRIFAGMQGGRRTGIAFANPSESQAEITYYFTDPGGNDLNRGTTTLGPRSQFAAFLDQDPFNSGSRFVGTFSWTSNVPLAAVAMQGVFEEGREIMTALPIARIEPRASETQVIAQFADGGGWTTRVVLVNTTDIALKGSLRFLGKGSGEGMAEPIEVSLDGVNASSFSYELPPRSARELSTDGLQSRIRSGSIWIVPESGAPAPSALGIFTFVSGGNTISMAGFPALVPGSRFRIYAEASGGSFKMGDVGATMTGLAVSNVSEKSIVANLALRRHDGTIAGTASLPISPRGQRALFLCEIPGFDTMGSPQLRMLEVSSEPGAIAVAGVLARINERGDFLIAATPPVDEGDSSISRVLPHIADGGGYSTRIVIASTTTQNAKGRIEVLLQSGKPWEVVLR